MIMLFILMFGLLPAVCILDLCIVQRYFVGDIISLCISAAFAILYFVYLPHVEERTRQNPNSNPYNVAKRIQSETQQKYEQMIDISQLIQEKPTNCGVPRQITESDRGAGSYICTEKVFMRKMKHWIETNRWIRFQI